MMIDSDPLIVFVNGDKHVVYNVDPCKTLLQFLRLDLGLTGAKLGCGEGGCGACTVVIGCINHAGKIDHFAVNACLMPVGAVHLKHVITVEGLGGTATFKSKGPHPIQEAFGSKHASQCGYCTPGFVMSLYAMARNGVSYEQAIEREGLFDGNLCRCTGYRPILDAAKQILNSCPMGKDCCRLQQSNDSDVCMKIDETQELIFPPELLVQKQNTRLTIFKTDSVLWIAPKTVNDCLSMMAKYPDYKLVMGNTEIGIEEKARKEPYPVHIYTGDIQELQLVTLSDVRIILGSGVTLSKMKDVFEETMSMYDNSHKTRFLSGFLKMLMWFAGRQIRNVAGWVGNLCNASPISDLNPLFLLLDCTINVMCTDGTQKQIKTSDFILGYKKVNLNRGELVLSIEIPLARENEFLFCYKQSKRLEDDISIVCAAFKVTKNGENVIIDAAFGGVAAKTLLFRDIFSNGKPVTLEAYEEVIFGEIKLDKASPGGFHEYRKVLISSLFVKMMNELNGIGEPSEDSVHHNIEGVQDYPQTDEILGAAKPHLAGLVHATGEAVYCDDVPWQRGELYAGLVLSKISHGKIVNVDYSMALAIPDVHSVIHAKNVLGANMICGERVFLEEEITSTGQLIAIVLANSQSIAQRAAKLVEVNVQELPCTLTIEEAIESESFFDIVRRLKKGDVEEALKKDLTVSGQIRIHGQEHFYLETQACIVYPAKTNIDRVNITASTQNPSEAQRFVAQVLGLHESRVTCKVERLGGGFGGKETRSSFFIAAIAVCAQSSGHIVRCQLDRDEDFVMSGQRHPFLADYTVGFTADGMLTGAKVDLYSNAGHSIDLSIGVMERALSHLDNCYYFPNALFTGKLCRTNTPSNTAFRGFGGPQGMFVCEVIMDAVARHLRMDADKVRFMNLYQRTGQVTPFNMTITDCSIREMWMELTESCDLTEIKNEIREFNKDNKTRKRGVQIVPTKFGIAFGLKHLNQAGSLVHILQDGTVQVHHGGVEMGQGIGVKMAQIAADALAVDYENVFVFVPTDTSHVANTSASAASATSDLNGMAVRDACLVLKERLALYVAREKTFKEAVQAAYKDRIDLSARGFYRTPDLDFAWATQQGERLFNYFTFGVAMSVVEIDCLTGSTSILRSDVFMDLGCPINPAIDLGQIEGAFVQGIGLFTVEELLWTGERMLTVGPSTYKLPSVSNCSRQFNVKMYEGNPNPTAINSGREVGEPPLFLAASCFFAIKEAIYAARQCDTYFRLDSPATCARIRMAIDDDISNRHHDKEFKIMDTRGQFAFQI